MAIETRLGWILSGPVEPQVTSSVLSVRSSHTLKVEVCATDASLDDQLKKFWELESLGIANNEISVYDKFVQKISFNGKRYEVCLPWKPNHPPLPDHFELCQKRLSSLLRRLRQNPSLFSDYDSVIREQLNRGMIEEVRNPCSELHDHIHYLPMEWYARTRLLLNSELYTMLQLVLVDHPLTIASMLVLVLASLSLVFSFASDSIRLRLLEI